MKRLKLCDFRPVRAIIFDLAGTLGDHRNQLVGASLKAIMRDPRVTDELIARDIGRAKRPHIQKLHDYLKLPYDDAKLDRLTNEFVDDQEHRLLDEMQPIAGVPALFKRLRQRGIYCAYTTGFPKRLANAFTTSLSRHGIHFDYGVASDEVKYGRPHPFMINKIIGSLRLDKSTTCKVGDAIIDVHEAINAGVNPVAVTETGSYREIMTNEDVGAMMLRAGAQYVLDDVTDLA